MYQINYPKNSFWLALGFFCSSIFLVSCENKKKTLPFYNTPEFEPIFLQNETEISQKITHKIANFSFLDQEKKYFSQKNIQQKIHVANFIFTTCESICPTMTNHLQKSLLPFANDTNVLLVSFSVMPWIDTPEKLKKYKIQKNITQENWHFVTGNKKEIYDLARKSYFAEEDIGFAKDSSEFLHTEHVILVDKNQHIRGIYNGTLLLDMRQLAEDILILKKEE